jgi:hypothetical protein
MVEWKSILEYRGGELFWIMAPKGHPRLLGCRAGSLSRGPRCGYIKIQHNGRKYLAHRIVWELFNGPVPFGSSVDHISRVRTDNRIENLRLSGLAQQAANAGKRRTGGGSRLTSKYKGVSARRSRKFGPRFRTVIYRNKTRIYGGTFSCEKEAAYAYNELAQRFHGEFAVLNEVT